MTTRLTIERPIRFTNDEGEPVITWEPVCKVWADARPLSSYETVRYAQVQFQTTHIVKLRYLPWLKTDHRFTYTDPSGCHVLNILSRIDVENRHTELELQAVEVTNG